MGRPAKPAELHIIDGKKHFSKAELQQRLESEIRLGDGDLKAPSEVRHNKVARKKWRELVDLYRGIDFVSSSDVGAIAQLCLAYAELDELLRELEYIRVTDIPKDPDNLIEAAMGERQARAFWAKLDHIVSIDGQLKIHKSIDNKRNIIRALEDRLFLNPLAKIRNIPKQKKEKSSNPLEQQGFGNV